MVPQAYQNLQHYSGNYAGIGRRFGAYLLDCLVIMLAAAPAWIFIFIGMAVMAGSAESNSEEGAAIGVILMFFGMYILYPVLVLGMFLYNTYRLGRDGATLGKKWMGIKVLDRYGNVLGFWKALGREFLKGLIVSACFILGFWPLWDEQKQALYDKAVDSNVYE